MTFFILGDDIFPLKPWLMWPYSSRSMDLKEMVFNYRISRGRSVVENAFGMLTSRFRIFQRPLQQEVPVVSRVVMACLVLCNLLRIRYPTAHLILFTNKPRQKHNLLGRGNHNCIGCQKEIHGCCKDVTEELQITYGSNTDINCTWQLQSFYGKFKQFDFSIKGLRTKHIIIQTCPQMKKIIRKPLTIFHIW